MSLFSSSSGKYRWVREVMDDIPEPTPPPEGDQKRSDKGDDFGDETMMSCSPVSTGRLPIEVAGFYPLPVDPLAFHPSCMRKEHESVGYYHIDVLSREAYDNN